MSRENKFTPGPWFSDGSKGENYPCISDDSGTGNLLAQTFCCSDGVDYTAEQAEANANLIAAAPELLEALEEALKWHKGDKWRDSNGSERERWRQHNELLESAIKKAYGETK